MKLGGNGATASFLETALGGAGLSCLLRLSRTSPDFLRVCGHQRTLEAEQLRQYEAKQIVGLTRTSAVVYLGLLPKRSSIRVANDSSPH